MIEIAVNNLVAATGARTVTGEADRVCRGCVIDSRQVEEGTIFVAFPGENVDGNDFGFPCRPVGCRRRRDDA